MGAWTYDSEWLAMDGYDAFVTYKNMKSLSVRIKPPHGEVMVSAPLFTPEHVIVDFLRGRHDWVQHHQAAIRLRSVGPSPLVTGSRVPLWGAWREVVVEEGARASARIVAGNIHIRRPGDDDDAARRAVDALYRRELVPAVMQDIGRWETRVGRCATEVRVKRMKSRWGSCNTQTGALTFNSMLAKFSPKALEMVVVHELVHLLERGHGEAFKAHMNVHLPDWPVRRQMLREDPC
ncbi:MAG: M48 family metallopeptidase [Arachnia sp.]